ncbi:cyclic nucleotide-binding domain-containing protein [Novosphingobium sp. JCM 18896]|uniref:cyclic nucleotide-binding domain-containing protein n=1 Tax=Novosphingobium sp. JCM 18896 TaxID=2989731 RepID=UPI0022219F91|nr:cyclic nucleotide-binding domain-containing protein [Novosphingobium sp. JCM 18896]MCW1429071.1 cyclic nucleotide-binding domain-containing protein [Novosphingobium sp. JCM 18896]
METRVRIAVIGSGPAGLSAASRAAQLGLAHVLIEKTDHLSDTIYKYQKGKHVMATPSSLVLRSDLDFEAGKREVVLGTWDEQTAGNKVNVLYEAEITAITGEKGNFSLKTKKGDVVIAETVILAIGTQGNPNLVRCPVEDGAQVQYQLDDPGEYIDEHITVIGAGDAGIENAMGLAADPQQRNKVTIVNRSADFATAKDANVKALVAMEAEGRITVLRETTASRIDKGSITFDTRDGELTVPCDRVIARMGSAPPRAFVEGACAEFEEKDGRKVIKPGTGIEFTSADRVAYPKLSPAFESTVPGIYVIGALAGYPLIKHCMNQGYDVVEFINGNKSLKPADEPILADKFAKLPGNRSVDEWLTTFGSQIDIFKEVSPLQLRELMLDSTVAAFDAGEAVFERNEPGTSLFAIAEGSVLVEIDKDDPSKTVPLPQGSIFGEVGLISGRRRGSTIRAAEPTVVVELARNAALKLISTVPPAGRAITRTSIERQLLQIFGSGLTSADVAEVVAGAEVKDVRAGDVVLTEGDTGDDIYVIRRGSMIVEKTIAGKPVFLSYLPAGSYVGEMALIDGQPRSATVKAAIKSEVIRLPGEAFARLLEKKPQLLAKAQAEMATRRDVNAFIEGRKDIFSSVVDMYSETARFLVDNGIGEATDVLLIDETLCVGCDNCEKACADSHEGLSRLDREAGKTYAHLHVPTSCRHCEHPHCMADCPPNAIKRGPDGEVFIDDTCIGCGNCQRNCPYGVIRMDSVPPPKPSLLEWLFFGKGPGPGEPSYYWRKKNAVPGEEKPKKAIKCDMCSGIEGGPACVRACPTGAAIRVAPEAFLTVSRLGEDN